MTSHLRPGRRGGAVALALAAVLALGGCASGPERPRDAGRGDGSGRALPALR